MRRKLPPYVPLMALVTACYLTVEIPFSVRLVEVLGGSPSKEDIDAMENFGRMLTGVAVSIWIVGVLLFPRLHARGRGMLFSLVAAAFVGMASTWATFTALDAIAHYTGFNSTGMERKEAFLSVVARNQIAADGSIGGLASTGENDWNAFIAVSPMLSSAETLSSVYGTNLQELVRSEARRLVGGPDQMRTALFGEQFESVRRAYERYSEGSRKYLDAKANLNADAAEAWNRLQAELHRKYPDGLPESGFFQAPIVRHIKFDLGIPVDQYWDIRDRAGFIGPYKTVALQKIEKAYSDEMLLQMGEGETIRAGLDMDGFVAQPAIQKRIREAIGLASSTVAITPKMSEASFAAQVYAPKVAAAEREFAEAMSAPVSDFEAGGRFAKRGIDSVKAARLPAMAILLSIAGAALHIYKLSGYLSRLLSSTVRIGFLGGPFRHAVAASVAIAAFAAMASSGNAVVQSPAYSQVKGDGIYATLLHGAISIQPRFSTLGETLGLGGWQAFAADMPTPVSAIRHETSSVAALPQGKSIPLPTPASR